MSKELTEAQKTEEFRQANDAARAGDWGKGFAFVGSTPGVQALASHEVYRIINLIKRYRNWTQGNDPYDEHDFGTLTCVKRDGERLWTDEP